MRLRLVGNLALLVGAVFTVDAFVYACRDEWLIAAPDCVVAVVSFTTFLLLTQRDP